MSAKASRIHPGTQYMGHALSPEKLATSVADVSRVLRAVRGAFDGLAFRGMSGAAIGFPVCAATGIPPIVVRSSKVSSHSTYAAEAVVDVSRYVIVDDFVDSGETLKAISDALAPAACVGVVLYADKFQIGGPHDDCAPSLEIPILVPVLSHIGRAHPECEVPEVWAWEHADEWIAAVRVRGSGPAQGQPSPYSEGARP